MKQSVRTTCLSFLFSLLACSAVTAQATDTVRLPILFDTVCRGAVVTGAATRITARANGDSYRWNTLATTASIQPTISDLYVVTITAPDGTVTLDSQRVTVIQVRQDLIPFALEPGPYCRGQEIRFTTNLFQYDSLEWFVNTNLISPGAGIETDTLTLLFEPGTSFLFNAYYGGCGLRQSFFPPLTLSEDDLAGEPADAVFLNDFPPEACAGDSLTLELSVSNADALRWFDGPGNLDSLTRTIVLAEGEATFSATVFGPCNDSLTIVSPPVFTEDCTPEPPEEVCAYTFPEIISPNGDGTNDLFRLFTNCPVTGYDLRIFNRWGQEIFTSDASGRGWDGTAGGQPQEIGNYLYRASWRTDGGEVERREGAFVVVR